MQTLSPQEGPGGASYSHPQARGARVARRRPEVCESSFLLQLLLPDRRDVSSRRSCKCTALVLRRSILAPAHRSTAARCLSCHSYQADHGIRHHARVLVRTRYSHAPPPNSMPEVVLLASSIHTNPLPPDCIWIAAARPFPFPRFPNTYITWALRALTFMQQSQPAFMLAGTAGRHWSAG